ncbi:hypothetical protein ACQKCJ_16365 [Flavobacterium sp. NPDC079362]|uniref:hypothetical protein n=1 Tax=Flavobacterium sp. NPDC079362 TaxID=3390566 RepID=UPI003D02A915
MTPYALDANVVHKTGTEDLHGRKRFFSDNTESGGIDIYGSVFNGGKMLNISPGSGANSSGIGITVSGGARGIEVDTSSEAGDAIFVQARSGSAAFVANGGTGFSGNLFLGTNNGSTTSSIDKLGNGFFNGNVGIGISKPLSVGGGSKWLTIDGTTSYGGGFISSINGVGKGFYYYDNGFAKVQADGGSGIRLVVGGTNALTVLPNGNTLVGTTTDNEAKFQVNGTISTTGIVSNYIANNALVVYNSMTNYTSLNTFGDSENVAGNVGFYSLESLRYNSTDGVQKITYINGANAGKLYVRVKSEGTWSAWVEK